MDNKKKLDSTNDNIKNELSKTEKSFTFKENKNTVQNTSTKIKTCAVMNYDKYKQVIRCRFDKYGIEVPSSIAPKEQTIKVEYTGEIGNPNFTFKKLD